MHDTARKLGELFLKHYVDPRTRVIVEVGALDVNGSLRKFSPEGAIYLGVDLAHGKSVDIVTKIEEPLPFRNDFADIVLSSSQMEHDSFFWESFCEYARIVKPGGHIYINTPSNGAYHRYPDDNWRFYPDCGRALERWARRNGRPVTLVESFVADRERDAWNDFVAVFAKEPFEPRGVFLSDQVKCRNIWRAGAETPLAVKAVSEDQEKIRELDALVKTLRVEAPKGSVGALPADQNGASAAESGEPAKA
ncbi:MAG TPA: methyltransferase domain-containing protein [Roseiarcus sp.]|nr:methyltransferase domain-containing protein [Roseiarcus sp.]